MSRLNEMLRELCPEGVEYRPLKDLCKIKEKEAITKSDLIDGGKYPVINSSREILGYYSRCNNEGDTLALTSHGAHAGFCHYMREPFFAGALCYPMQTSDVSVITTKFLYYLLKNGENHIRENFVNRSGVPYVNFKALMSYELPLPPLRSSTRSCAFWTHLHPLRQNLRQNLRQERGNMPIIGIVC